MSHIDPEGDAVAILIGRVIGIAITAWTLTLLAVVLWKILVWVVSL